MKLREISELLNATVRCGEDRFAHAWRLQPRPPDGSLQHADHPHLRDGQPRHHRPSEAQEGH